MSERLFVTLKHKIKGSDRYTFVSADGRYIHLSYAELEDMLDQIDGLEERENDQNKLHMRAELGEARGACKLAGAR